MGKRRNKPSAGKGAVGTLPTENLSSFDEKALASLTAKIEKGFENRNPEQHQTLDNSSRNHQKRKISNGKNSAEIKSKQGIPELTRGTKRDAQGNTKKQDKRAGKTKNDQVRNDRHKDKGLDEREILLQEILALGGTEEDLDLVATAVSDEEELDIKITNDADKSLRSELAKFVASLGIEAENIEDEDDLIEEEVGENGWEEASGQDTLSQLGDAEEQTSSIPGIEVPLSIAESISSLNSINRLVFESRPDWHAAPLQTLPIAELEDSSRYGGIVSSLKDYAVFLLDADSKLYASKHLSSSSSHRFLATIMSSGTLADKVSALTLVVQESPVHTTKSFESLLALAKKRSRGQAVTALGALKDLLGAGSVLPADRRLRNFEAQPGLLGTLEKESISSWNQGQPLPGKISKAHLISWAYEDWLKESYFDMLQVLESWCSDEVEYARSRAVTYVYELLKEKPEQEANLLRLLVNKLGDPDKKIASRTSYLLLQLQISHPLMKPIIIKSVENEVLLRPGQSSHAKYYAVNTLNQTILSAKEEEVAKKLLRIYFDLFVTLLKKPEPLKVLDGPVVNRKGQIQGGGAPMGKKAKAKVSKEEEAKAASEETTEKMISAVLTGVNRALPFSKSDDLTLEAHMDTLFKITHSSNFNTSVQALMLIEQLATSKHIAIDRFYRTLYESLLDPRLITSSKHAMYLNLLFKALRSDVNVKRVKAFAKRMLQVMTLHQPPFVCGVLYLLRELEAIFPGIKSLLNDPEENDTREDEAFRDIPEDGEAPPANEMDTLASDIKTSYNGRKRDPEHCNADRSCLWELAPFLVHFHPSVSLFAMRLLNGEAMPPKPDLVSHTLSNFLDRFVYRNAKVGAGGPRGGSIMQPLASSENGGMLLTNKSAHRLQQPVNSEAFWRKKAEDVAVDEVFFHKYFSQIGKSKQAAIEKKIRKTEEESDDEEAENEDEIWQALVDSRPEVEGNSEGDSDMDMLDLDDSDAEFSVEGSDMEVDEGGLMEASASDTGDEDTFLVESDVDKEDDKLFAKEARTVQGELANKEADSKKSRRKKMRNLPTFASVEDYAEMLENDDDEDKGL